MVRKHYENQNGSGSYSQKNPNRRRKSEQHGRNTNYQNNNMNQKPEAQNLQQNVIQGTNVQDRARSEVNSHDQNFPQHAQGNTGHGSGRTKAGLRGVKAYEPRSRDSGQQRGYSRDRNREMSSQRPKHSRFSGRYPGIYRNRPEETIEDIKQDIIRLEKEIDLEIKEIKSLKL